MNPVTDPANQGQDAVTPAPVPPAGGQPENWEARFKGLQREYNALKTTAESKETALGTVKSEYDAFKTSQADALQAAQLQIADLGNQHKATIAERDQIQTRAQQLELELGKQQARSEQRQKLVAAQGADLIEAFEAGHLNLDGVAEDALPAALTNFRSLAAKIAGQQFSGTTPTSPAVTPSANPTGLNYEQLGDWLQMPENFIKPEYETMHDAYLSLVPK